MTGKLSLNDLDELDELVRQRKADSEFQTDAKKLGTRGEKLIRQLLETRRGLPGKDGERGKDGLDGRPGHPGGIGPRGKDGLSGKDGRDGKDGKPGKDGRHGRDGKDGKQGPSGEAGRDGVTQVINSSAGTAFPRNNFESVRDPLVTDDMQNGGYR